MIEMSRQNHIIPIMATQITLSYQKTIREFFSYLAGRVIGKRGYQEFVNIYVANLNKWIREYCRTTEIFLLDFEPLLSNRRGFRKLKYSQKDGSHITQAGYARLSEFAIPLIKNYILNQENL